MTDLTFNRCALTGCYLKPEELKPITGPTIEYETAVVGKVKITIPAYKELLEGEFERYIIAGICKHKTINGFEPILIDSQFIREGYKKIKPSADFDEKCFELIKIL